MEFKDTVRTQREAAGWTKKKLAELVGVTQPYIVQIENDGKVPSDSVVLRLADALGVDRRELLFSAYRARAPKDLEDCFSTLLEEMVPGEGFDQPFVQSRGNHLESPDFVIRDLGTSVGGGFQITLIETKTPEAVLQDHLHKISVTLVVSEGEFEIEMEGETHVLSPESQVSMTIPPNVPHVLKARKMGKLISIGLGTVGSPRLKRLGEHLSTFHGSV